MSRKQKSQASKDTPVEITELVIPVNQDRKSTPFSTVGTCRRSKSGNALSIKLFADNRYLHISLKDAEAILNDDTNSVIGNVREYEKLENLSLIGVMK